jgi:hypothetical protein
MLFWVGGYLLHRNEYSAYSKIRASRKVRLLFGDFRKSGTSSVLGITVQVISYLLLLGGLIAETIIPDPYMRGLVLAVWLFGLLFLGAIFRAVVSRALE